MFAAANSNPIDASKIKCSNPQHTVMFASANSKTIKPSKSSKIKSNRLITVYSSQFYNLILHELNVKRIILTVIT